MNAARCWLLTVGIGVLLTGCAADARRTTAAPSEDELLKLEPPPNAIPAHVGVEGTDNEERRLVLVPSYEVPELTEEEREAVGIEPELVNFLEFYEPAPAETRTWPGQGGPAVTTSPEQVGVARAGAARTATKQGLSRKDVAVDYPASASVARPHPHSGTSVAGQGPKGGVLVGDSAARRVARPARRADP